MSTANKKQIVRKLIDDSHNCNGSCSKCVRLYHFIDQMDIANIPVEYWLMTKKTFNGPHKLKVFINDYSEHIAKNYRDGKSVGLIGGYGLGKTFSACSVLKKALWLGFDAYYISAADMVKETVEGKMWKVFKEKDFLVIDEVDSRFFNSPAQRELFGSIYENIFRGRCQNKFPTIVCSNDTNDFGSVFGDNNSQSIGSLHKKYLHTIYIAGTDLRQ